MQTHVTQISGLRCWSGVTACDSFGLTGPGVAHIYAGLPGNTSSSTGSVTLPGFGTAFGSATLGSMAVDGAPILEASASTVPGERATANVVALQSYTRDGAGPATRTSDTRASAMVRRIRAEWGPSRTR